MNKDEDKALRLEVSKLLRAMNKVTGTTAAEIARKVALHKGNISAFVNQSRVELLGSGTISQLLRMYGFEIRDGRICIRASQTCPVITFPLTDEVISGLNDLAQQMQKLEMPCSYRAFQIASEDHGLDEYGTGGLLFACDGTNTWAAICLDRSSDLAECLTAIETIAVHEDIQLHEDQFEEWRDSAPHRTEVTCFTGLASGGAN